MEKSRLFWGLVASVLLLFSTNSVFAEDCEEIVLGSAISLTGKYATNGVHAKNGYEFAIQKIKDVGGVTIGDKCYNFRVIYYDDESKGDRGATLAERLINQDEVQYMLGPYSSGLTKAIAPVTEKYQIPMVEAEGASRSLFNKGYKYLFAVLSTSEQYLASAITLAAEKATESGSTPADVKVAVAVENDPFSLDIRAGVLEDAAKYDMKIVIDEQLPRDLSDMSAILTKVKLLKPDVLIISGHSKGAATAVRQIEEQNVSAPMVAITHCEAADVVGNFGDAANDILCSTQWAETLTYSDPIFGSAAEYEQEFKATFSQYAEKPVPYQQHRRPLQCTYSRMRLKELEHWISKQFVMRLQRPILQRSMGRSNFLRQATTSPNDGFTPDSGWEIQCCSTFGVRFSRPELAKKLTNLIHSKV